MPCRDTDLWTALIGKRWAVTRSFGDLQQQQPLSVLQHDFIKRVDAQTLNQQVLQHDTQP